MHKLATAEPQVSQDVASPMPGGALDSGCVDGQKAGDMTAR